MEVLNILFLIVIHLKTYQKCKKYFVGQKIKIMHKLKNSSHIRLQKGSIQKNTSYTKMNFFIRFDDFPTKKLNLVHDGYYRNNPVNNLEWYFLDDDGKDIVNKYNDWKSKQY